MKISVIGVGYVGLVTGAGFADIGNHVLCVDIDSHKIEKLKQGIIPFFEPGLDVLVKHNQENGRLFFTTDIESAILNTDICFIAVGTPSQEDGSTNLEYVFTVAKVIGQTLKQARGEPKFIGIKSTVPVGTCAEVEVLIRKETDYPFYIFSNPEFLKEGDAVDDFINPDRVIIGIKEHKVEGVLKELYEPFNLDKPRTFFMSIESAELTKYAANAMLATRISFMNEMACFAEKMGANIEDVRIGIGSDPRIGEAFLLPGIGYGGSCLPKDVKSLVSSAKSRGMRWKILEAVEDVNEAQKRSMVEKILLYFDKRGGIQKKKIAIWGLSFKPNTDDVREAPSLMIIDALLSHEAQVAVYDPVAMENVKKIIGIKIEYCESPYQAIQDADALIIASEWHDFMSPDVEHMRAVMKHMAIFDGRNIYAKLKALRAVCDHYCGVGV